MRKPMSQADKKALSVADRKAGRIDLKALFSRAAATVVPADVAPDRPIRSRRSAQSRPTRRS